ncbi:hypothetical protein MTO96_028952 [Rhipicephalus appendiculatus]
MLELVADPNTKRQFNAMWDQRVYHYGQVNTPMRPSATTPSRLVMESARGLQIISDLMNDRKDPVLRPSYTILHFPLHAEQDVSHVAAALRSNPVDVIVFLAYHAETDFQYDQCRMVPPTIASSQLLPSLVNSEYPIRLDRVVAAMASGQTQWPADVSFALAFGMGGRWYMPRRPPNSISLGDECSHTRHPGGFQITSISTACADRGLNSTFHHDATYDAPVAYRRSDNWLFTYESAHSLRSKICKTKRTALDVNYTLAAVNIQFEDFLNYCGHGPHRRLVMLRTVAVFLARSYASADKESTCLTLLSRRFTDKK